ncbi:MAG TPA: extracellular solute-binding protein [Firmicutes bacterium]|nr:extracellular solute-binding protein [Bacillota bacterium]
MSKTKRNWLSALTMAMVVAVLASLMVAFPIAAEEEVTLRILGIGGWTPSELAVKMGPLFSKYAEEKLGYKANVVADFAPFTSLYEKAASAFAAKSSQYDIIISDSQWLGAFATGGHILKLNDIIEKDPALSKIVKDIYPQHIASYMTYPDGSDEWWGLPQEGDDLVLYVRKDLLNDPKEQAAFKAKYKIDLPRTYEDFAKLDWDTFHKVIEFFNRPPKMYGFAGEYAKEYDFISDHVMSMFWTWGGDIIDTKTNRVRGILNSKVNAEALKYYKDLLKFQPPGAISFGIDQVINAMAQGQVFSALTWAAVGRPIFDPALSKVHDKVMVVMPPGKILENGKFNRIYCLGGQPWVISKYSKHQKEAIDFLKWWYLPETQWEFARRGGNPVVRSVIDTEKFKELNPWNRAYVDMIPQGRDFWHLPCYAELLLIQQEEWTAYMSGATKDAQTANDNIARRQELVLRRDGFLK